MKKLIKTLLVVIVAIAIFAPATSFAQEVEQDDCIAGYIVNPSGTGCVRADDTNDPDDCRNAGGADAVEQCLAASRNGGPCNLNESFLALPTWYKYLDKEIDATGRCNPRVADAQAALPIGLAVLEGFIRVAGIVAVVMIFISGFKFITSQGNPESAKGARETAINALIGLVIVIVATSVVSFIGRSIV